jgi:hypothetical protein
MHADTVHRGSSRGGFMKVLSRYLAIAWMALLLVA